MTLPGGEKVEADDTTEDPLDRMLKKTGCIELHYKVQVNVYTYIYVSVSRSSFLFHNIFIGNFHA